MPSLGLGDHHDSVAALTEDPRHIVFYGGSDDGQDQTIIECLSAHGFRIRAQTPRAADRPAILARGILYTGLPEISRFLQQTVA